MCFSPSVLLLPRVAACYESVPYAIDECLAWSPKNMYLQSCRKGTVGHLLDGGDKLLLEFTIVVGPCLQLGSGP
jgi:hypothetical protein